MPTTSIWQKPIQHIRVIWLTLKPFSIYAAALFAMWNQHYPLQITFQKKRVARPPCVTWRRKCSSELSRRRSATVANKVRRLKFYTALICPLLAAPRYFSKVRTLTVVIPTTYSKRYVKNTDVFKDTRIQLSLEMITTREGMSQRRPQVFKRRTCTFYNAETTSIAHGKCKERLRFPSLGSCINPATKRCPDRTSCH